MSVIVPALLDHDDISCLEKNHFSIEMATRANCWGNWGNLIAKDTSK